MADQKGVPSMGKGTKGRTASEVPPKKRGRPVGSGKKTQGGARTGSSRARGR